MKTSDGLKCAVCGKAALCIASSSLGGYSHAYCAACLRTDAEPAGELHAQAVAVGGVEHLASWVLDLHTYHDGQYMTARQYYGLSGEEAAQQ